MGKADLCGSGYQLLSNENWKFSSEELTSSFEWLSISDKRCASRVSSCVQQGRRMDSLDWKHRKLQDAVTGLKSQTSVPLPPPSPPIVLPYLEQGAQGHIQVGLDVSKEEIPQPLWSLCQVSGTGTVQQCCPMSRRNQSLVTVFQLVPIKDNTVLKLWCTSYFFFTICLFILKEFPFFLLICLKEKHFTRERRSAVQKELLCWVLFQPCKHWGPLQAIPPHSRASSAQFGLLSAEQRRMFLARGIPATTDNVFLAYRTRDGLHHLYTAQFLWIWISPSDIHNFLTPITWKFILVWILNNLLGC